MAFDAGLLLMKLEAREQPVLRALDRIERSLKSHGSSVQVMVAGVRGGFASLSLMAAGSGMLLSRAWGAATFGLSFLIQRIGDASAWAVGLASDAAEVGSKFDVVFGDQADHARAALDDFGEMAGRSRAELRQMAATVQDTFVPLGFTRGQAAELSLAVTKLATDLASFNNEADVESLEALQSALIGNHETVRRFGVIITEATLNERLHAMGVADGTAAATEQQKALARLQLILEGTSDAQGDSTRTADSFANMSKALGAVVQDIGIELGGMLIPALKVFIGGAREAIAWTRANSASLQEWGQQFGNWAAGLKGAIQAAWALLDFELLWQKASLTFEETLTHMVERVEWFTSNAWNQVTWFFTNFQDIASTTAGNYIQLWLNVYHNFSKLWAAVWDYLRTGNKAGMAAAAAAMLEGMKDFNSSPALEDFKGTDFSQRWKELDAKSRGKMRDVQKDATAAAAEQALDIGSMINDLAGGTQSRAKFAIGGVEQLFRKNLLDRFEESDTKKQIAIQDATKVAWETLAKNREAHQREKVAAFRGRQGVAP